MARRATVRQSGVIPYRVSGGEVHVLLVSSRSGKRWIVPKGNLEEGLSEAESAGKEAAEEAGAVGFVEGKPVGVYHYRKRGRRHEVALYPMRVMRLRPVWEEMGERERRWAPAHVAAEVVEHKRLGECIRALGECAEAVSAAA